MRKVLIADDEKKVCQLIVNLVDWEAFGFEISEVVYDGISAYKYLQEHPVHVMITDIRMPGVDGMELIQKARVLYPEMYIIIISGYSQFDYAQNAIRYGVEDYLLKPLRKKDLTATLQKIGDKCRIESRDAKKWTQMQKKLEENEERVKRSFLEDVLKRPEKFGGFFSREKINEEYHYHFADTYYRTLIVKIIPGKRREDADTRRILLQKGQQILLEALEKICNETVLNIIDGEIYGIVNGTEEEMASFHRKLKRIRLDFQRLSDVFVDTRIYVAQDMEIEGIQNIIDSFQKARNVMQGRFFYEDKCLLTECEDADSQKHAREWIDNGFKKKFLGYIEILDMDSIENELDLLTEKLENCPVRNGNIVYETYKEVLTLFYFGVHHYDISIPDQYTELMQKLELYDSIEEAFHFLKGYIASSLVHWLEEKKYVESRPVRVAKRYIGENYYKSLTLDMVSSEIGFNPTYFSGMFKKETNMNFSEYLKSVRIDHAKDMLLNTSQTVEDISYAVGYSDIKYFSRLFKKMTGITPTEFRRLYN